MATLSTAQVKKRSKTLLTALLLSAPGPLVTGLAVLSSHSTTQLADFIRRSVELVTMFISWWIFRRLHKDTPVDQSLQKKMERTVGVIVSGAMICSGAIMVIIAISRLSAYQPGGNVLFGLVIAILGLLTNSWFWWRYTTLTREQYSSVIASQQQLYRAKAVVDLCVVISLATVAILPAHPVTRYVDIMGSVTVAGYLLWSGFRLAKSHMGGARFSSQLLLKGTGAVSWLSIHKSNNGNEKFEVK